jgi:hypothetical protein
MHCRPCVSQAAKEGAISRLYGGVHFPVRPLFNLLCVICFSGCVDVRSCIHALENLCQPGSGATSDKQAVWRRAFPGKAAV